VLGISVSSRPEPKNEPETGPMTYPGFGQYILCTSFVHPLRPRQAFAPSRGLPPTPADKPSIVGATRTPMRRLLHHLPELTRDVQEN